MKNNISAVAVEVEYEDHAQCLVEHRTSEGGGELKQGEALLVTDREIGATRFTHDYNRFGQLNVGDENQIEISKLVRFFTEPVDLNDGEIPGTLKFIASLELSAPLPVLPYYAKFGLTLALTLKEQNQSGDFKNINSSLQIFTQPRFKTGILQITSYDSANTGDDNCKRSSFEKHDLDAFPIQNSIQISLNFLDDQCWPVISKTTSSFTVTTGAATSWTVSENFLTSNQCSVLLDQCLLTRKRSKLNHLNSYSFIIQSRLDFTINIKQLPIILTCETGIPIKRNLKSVIPNCFKLKYNLNLTSILFDRISQADFSYPFSLIYSKEVRSHWEFLRDEVLINLTSSRQLEKETRFQLDCSQWRKKRMLLITTSKFDRFAYLKETEDAYLIQQEAQYVNIGFTSSDNSDQDISVSEATSKSNSTVASDGQDPTNNVLIDDTNGDSEDFDYKSEQACAHGRIYEKDAISLFLKIYEDVITAHCEVGLCIQPKLPYLGTSPDYLVAIHGELHIVEVKCPYKLFRTGQSIVDRTRSAVGNFFLQVDDDGPEPGNEQAFCSSLPTPEYIHCNKTPVVDNGSGNSRLNTKLRINPKNKVYFQIQGQLNLCNVERGILIVFVPPNDIQVVFVQKDTQFFYRLLRKLSRIWFTRILPKLAIPFIPTMEDEEEEI